VLLAFLIISVWETFHSANQAVSHEAAALITVARDTELLPPTLRGQILDQLHSYTVYVMNDEWNTMRNGTNEQQIAAPQALAASTNLWVIFRQLPPSTMNAEMLRSLNDLSEQRVARLMASQDSLPGIFWFVLVTGALMTISFSFILRVADVRLHIFMVLLLTCAITLCLWLIVLMNDPFVGTMQVSADPLKYALYVIDTLPR
jgi:ABC-type branched-subunit amino acid transport system permease subunit